jgi:hypothetical protein
MSAKLSRFWLDSKPVRLTAIALIISIIVTFIGKPFYAPSYLTFDLKTSTPDHFTVYFNTGSGYNEKEQQSITLQQSGQKSSLKFRLPTSKIHSLRFDPGTHSGEVQIFRLCLSSLQKSTCWDGASLYPTVTSISGIAKLSVHDDFLQLMTYGRDPALDLGEGLTTAHRVLTKIPSLLIFSLMFAGIVFIGTFGPILYRFISRLSEIYPRNWPEEKLFSLSLTISFILIAGFTALHHEMWRDELTYRGWSGGTVIRYMSCIRTLATTDMGIIVELLRLASDSNYTESNGNPSSALSACDNLSVPNCPVVAL